ncbi:hypothetical protein HanRHA438_Chr04g0190141 [Helianthus annuus]|nr:hypothetical protein HanIR_Chr04g0194141 [Helianthus annuus]KAJ0928086.1 hypothetical protein HanRHA438_Chr04g0190141 [Helianthus annuus]
MSKMDQVPVPNLPNRVPFRYRVLTFSVPYRYRYRTVPYRVYSVPVAVPTFEDFRYRYFRFRYRFDTELIPNLNYGTKASDAN